MLISSKKVDALVESVRDAVRAKLGKTPEPSYGTSPTNSCYSAYDNRQTKNGKAFRIGFSLYCAQRGSRWSVFLMASFRDCVDAFTSFEIDLTGKYATSISDWISTVEYLMENQSKQKILNPEPAAASEVC